MNFTPELTALQGVMISADNINSFSKLTAKGGYEDEIEEVITTIKHFLWKEKYADQHSLVESTISITRKFAFYIILNSDLRILESMVEMDGIDFLIWTIPTVPKCLMCEMIWKLYMDRFVGEIIAFCCPKLSIEVAEAFTNHMKYLNPTESADKVKLVTAACYKLICRLNFFNIDERLLNSLLIIFQKCVKYFSNPPNVGKLEGLRRNQFYKYLGESLYKLLILLHECLEEFNGVQKYKLSEEVDIYMLTYNDEIVVNKHDVRTVESNNMILECLHKCHEALMESLQELVMGVSVDVFCTWSEFEEKGKTMQQIIGELSYKLRPKLERVVEHPVVQMLEQISCKPVEVEDVINTTSSEDIIENINTHDRALWLQALLKKDNLCKDLSLVQTLISNLDILKKDDFDKLYETCIEHINNSTENIEAVKLLAIKTFQYCDISSKYNIIDKTFIDNCFTNKMETTEFNEMTVKIFNKLISTPDTDVTDILTVFIQNPKKIFHKIFILATENAQQSEIMGRILKHLEKYSNFYYNQDTDECVITILKDIIVGELDSEAKQNNFFNFVSCVKENNIISGAKLLLLVVMPNLHDALLTRRHAQIYVAVKMLSMVYTLEELLEYRAPMLAIIAQVLDVERWKMHTFDNICPSCVELAIKLQTSLMETYQNIIPEKESLWLKNKLKDKNPMNMYYYRKLWATSGENYLEILTGIKVHEAVDVENLTFSLSQILCFTVADEWYQLWESFSTLSNTIKLDIFHKSLSMIATAEKDHRTVSTWACLLHCFRNFLLLVRYKYIHEPVDENQVVTIVNKLASFANLLLESETEEFNSISLPLLAYIAEVTKDRILDVPTGDIKNETFAGLVQKLFSKENV
ncbi:uncharacterized protein LOC106712314 [Papilio machaon]|uniref:uncharacterized protein LOC106712314 n=1 Tax=Papilio machaon TaxID=76193 RepID=UPI001E665FE6|nr:uncharacterized protein LOC106712314 [Papilio machaon]XP_045542306.1 uncharacterized protein LOC106712314 [Papilio machaon]